MTTREESNPSPPPPPRFHLLLTAAGKKGGEDEEEEGCWGGMLIRTEESDFIEIGKKGGRGEEGVVLGSKNGRSDLFQSSSSFSRRLVPSGANFMEVPPPPPRSIQTRDDVKDDRMTRDTLCYIELKHLPGTEIRLCFQQGKAKISLSFISSFSSSSSSSSSRQERSEHQQPALE